MATKLAVIRIYLTNLGKYNEGELIGEWVDLPTTAEELEAVKQRIGINEYYEEWFITDYESDIDGVTVGEYDSLTALNELAEELASLDDYELEIIETLLDNGYDFAQAKDALEDCIFFDNCDNMTDVAYAVVEMCDYLANVPETISRYFDYEAFGRDLSFEGEYYFTNNGNAIEVTR